MFCLCMVVASSCFAQNYVYFTSDNVGFGKGMLPMEYYYDKDSIRMEGNAKICKLRMTGSGMTKEMVVKLLPGESMCYPADYTAEKIAETKKHPEYYSYGSSGCSVTKNSLIKIADILANANLGAPEKSAYNPADHGLTKFKTEENLEYWLNTNIVEADKKAHTVMARICFIDNSSKNVTLMNIFVNYANNTYFPFKVEMVDFSSGKIIAESSYQKGVASDVHRIQSITDGSVMAVFTDKLKSYAY